MIMNYYYLWQFTHHSTTILCQNDINITAHKKVIKIKFSQILNTFFTDKIFIQISFLFIRKIFIQPEPFNTRTKKTEENSVTEKKQLNWTEKNFRFHFPVSIYYNWEVEHYCLYGFPMYKTTIFRFNCIRLHFIWSIL